MKLGKIYCLLRNDFYNSFGKFLAWIPFEPNVGIHYGFIINISWKVAG